MSLVLNPLLTDGEVRSSRWWIYPSRRRRDSLGLSPKSLHGVRDRIPKRARYALNTVGCEAWKVKNQKNSNCK